MAVLDLGIVAKIDLAEIRAPFVRAATIVASIGLILMLVGGLIFFRVGDPMVRRLIRSERDLRNVTNLTPVGIYRSDTDGRLTYVNDRWREIMDLPGDAALNDGWINSMHP